MIRHRIAAALCAVFLFVPMLCGTALAAEPDAPPDVLTEAVNTPAEAGSDPSADEPSVSAIEEKELVAPPGVGTVVEHGINGDNKEFYTIMTAEEYVFYLIIDHERAGQNVYFLNAVTINDLVALAEKDGKTVDPGSVSAIPDPKDKPKTNEPDPEPSPEPEPGQEQGGSNMGMIVLVLVVLAGGGGAGYYFKVYRPKQQRASEADDYDYDEDEADPYEYGTEPEDTGGDQAWYGEEDTAVQYADIAENDGEAEGSGDGEE